MPVFLLLLQSVVGLSLNYFTTPVFTDLQGWVLSAQPANSIGSYSGQSYAGLVNEFYGSLFIMIYDIPPHQLIRLRAKLLFQETSGWEMRIAWQIDHSEIWHFTQKTDNTEIMQFDISFQHNAESVLLKYIVWKNAQLLSGIRDVYLDFIPCPPGCVKCQAGQDQQSCSKFSKLDFQLSSSNLANFNNDGWYFQDKSKTYSIYQCGDLKINFFGIFNKTEVLTKMLILPPHYYLQIEILVMYLRQRQVQSLNTQFEIDGKVAESNNIGILRGFYEVCHYPEWKQSTDVDDGVERFQFNVYHQNRFTNLTIYQQYLEESTTLWLFRDFQIFYKACHSSCTQACVGPYARDCTKQSFTLTTLFQFFFDQHLSVMDGWTVIKSYSQSTICSNKQILGGYQKLQANEQLSYTIYNITQHTFISISLTLYQIDEFGYNEKFLIYLNEVKVYEKLLTQLTVDNSIDFCGSATFLDKMYPISIGKILHTSKNAIITFTTSQSSSSQGSWGIRDVSIYYEKQFLLLDVLKAKKDEVVKNWQMIQNNPQIKSCVNGNYDFIGYFSGDSIVRKLYTNIPIHPQLIITFKVIVAYLATDAIPIKLWLNIDNQEIWSQVFDIHFAFQACDSSLYSSIYKFETYINHNLTSAMFEFYSNFSSNQYWGIREFQLDLFDNTSPV